MTTEGKKIGTHSGAEFYTIGERHIKADFKFPKTGGAKERKPFYVASKDVAANVVVVAEGDENPALYHKEIELAGVNFIDGQSPEERAQHSVCARPLSPAAFDGNSFKRRKWQL